MRGTLRYRVVVGKRRWARASARKQVSRTAAHEPDRTATAWPLPFVPTAHMLRIECLLPSLAVEFRVVWCRTCREPLPRLVPLGAWSGGARYTARNTLRDRRAPTLPSCDDDTQQRHKCTYPLCSISSWMSDSLLTDWELHVVAQSNVHIGLVRAPTWKPLCHTTLPQSVHCKYELFFYRFEFQCLWWNRECIL